MSNGMEVAGILKHDFTLAFEEDGTGGHLDDKMRIEINAFKRGMGLLNKRVYEVNQIQVGQNFWSE